MFRFLLLLWVLSSCAYGECLPVTGDRITGHDLALVEPAFAALPETAVIGYAPLPGAVRTLSRTELESLARTHRIQLSQGMGVCFTVAQAPELNAAEAVSAMRKVLPPKAHLELLELIKTAVPVGDIVFPLEALEPPQPADPSVQTWRGFVQYGGSKRMPVWARVRLTVERSAVVAKRALRPGEVLTAGLVSVEVQHGPLRPERIASTEEEAIGKTVLRPLKQGDVIPLNCLERPLDLHRGDAVKVEVVNGSARLLLNAIAESSAREGDIVQLRNPASGKMFRARLKSSDLAVVNVGVTNNGRLQ